jgi:hypothetical protein
MVKRVMITGMVAISLVLTLGTEAKAQSIWNVQFFWGTIDCASILNGISKKAAASLLVECKILVEEVNFDCTNPAGNPKQSSSHVFRPQNASVSASTLVTLCTLEKETGKWHCDQTISNEQIENALEQDPDLADACPSGNWSIQLDAVTEMVGKVTVFSCNNLTTGNICSPGSPGCTCATMEDTFCADCSLPGGVSGQYSCRELSCQ